MINPNILLPGFKTLLQFFACLQALDSLHIGKHKTSSVSHQIPFFLSSAESITNTCQGQHSWLLYLDRPSWESWETMWWCSKDIEMYMQGDFPWDPALTIVLAFASVRLQEQYNKNKEKVLPEKLGKTQPGQLEWHCRTANEKRATELQMGSPLYYIR